MIKIVILFCVFFVITPARAADEVKCNADGNQAEINACARDELAKADGELNRTYQALIKQEAEDKLFIEKLRLAQRAWLAFRDADLEARFACAEDDVRFCWGSMYPMSFMFRKAELTRERTGHLKQLLTEGRGE